MSDNTQDIALLKWFKLLAFEASKNGQDLPSINIEGSNIVVKAKDPFSAAFACRRQKEIVRKTRFGLKIYVGDKFFDEFPPIHQQLQNLQPQSMIDQIISTNSTWAKQNQLWLKHEITRNTVAVHSASSETGYQFLDVFPLLGVEGILAVPVNQLTNKPLPRSLGDFAPGIPEDACLRAITIAQYKQVVIQDAIGQKDVAIKNYSVEWKGRTWQKVFVAIPVSNEEVVVLTKTPDTMQFGYWQAVADNMIT